MFWSCTNYKSGKDSPYRTDPGEQYSSTYVESIDSDGQPILVESGKIDLHELHETGRSLCDLKTLIQRFSRGDLTALEQRDSFYADVTELPTTPQEVANLSVRANSIFMTLPAELRAKFNGNMNVWLSKLMSGDDVAMESVGLKKQHSVIDSPVVSSPAASAAEVAAKEVEQ